MMLASVLGVAMSKPGTFMQCGGRCVIVACGSAFLVQALYVHSRRMKLAIVVSSDGDVACLLVIWFGAAKSSMFTFARTLAT